MTLTNLIENMVLSEAQLRLLFEYIRIVISYKMNQNEADEAEYAHYPWVDELDEKLAEVAAELDDIEDKVKNFLKDEDISLIYEIARKHIFYESYSIWDEIDYLKQHYGI